MRDLTAFQRDILFTVVKMHEPKGLDVRDQLEKYYEKEIRHGRLYPNLDTLVEKAFLEKGKHDQRTNKYVPTERGKQALEDRIEWELDGLPEEIDIEIKPMQ